jgi:START domain
MQRHRIHILTFLLVAVAACTSMIAQDNWVYKGEKDGVKVYLKIKEGVYDVKLTTSIQTSLSAFCHLMADVESYPKWGYKVAKSALLDQKDDFNLSYHTQMDFPWPLNDRDATLVNEMSQDVNGKITFQSKSTPGLYPEQKDIIRMDDVQTTWILFPPKNGWCYLEYYIHSNPEGSLPEWLVNLAIDVGPRETVTAIKRELRKPKYQTVRLAHIRD